jgi:hypothetical protein
MTEARSCVECGATGKFVVQVPGWDDTYFCQRHCHGTKFMAFTAAAIKESIDHADRQPPTSYVLPEFEDEPALCAHPWCEGEVMAMANDFCPPHQEASR